VINDRECSSKFNPLFFRRGYGGRGGGECALGVEAFPPKFYYEQGRKLLETIVQVQCIHCIVSYTS